jgi:hypothetical protein
MIIISIIFILFWEGYWIIQFIRDILYRKNIIKEKWITPFVYHKKEWDYRTWYLVFNITAPIVFYLSLLYLTNNFYPNQTSLIFFLWWVLISISKMDPEILILTHIQTSSILDEPGEE